ncbi:unnamed protein product [Durusdinium trenchii]|uniref:Thioester reductase (TE) domain-containing protein n=1 Tax=Durusdinium trenchii TaxID=1381693 RepID=A0ABP0QSQ6_9DINO
MLLVLVTKWLVIGRYTQGSFSVESWAFLRWWLVDRLVVFVNELCFSAFRGGPVFFAYLRALGLRARGYCRIDTRYVSEFDLITLGNCCVVAEGAKLRPAVAEAGTLHLRGLVFGDHCAVGENAVCTAGCVAGDNVTLQPLSLFSGRTGRTLPDGSVWKGAPLVQSRQQPIRVPPGMLGWDLCRETFAFLLALFLQILCSMCAYCAFGWLAEVQGFVQFEGEGVGTAWKWQEQGEGWLFAATWLLFGPPVMASADVLLGLDLASITDKVGEAMGIGRLEFGIRLAGMVAISFAVYGWSLTISSALLCRFIRGSRSRNSWFFQVRRVVLRLTFFRYPAQLSGTWAMSAYLSLLGSRCSLYATVAVTEPPLEPRKLHVAKGALLLSHQALGECEVGQGAIVAADAVMLPHSVVEARGTVGAMSVAGRPVRSDLQLVGNPGVIMRRGTLSKTPATSWGWRWLRAIVCLLYPLLAPGLLQLLLLITLLPAMYLLTIVLATFTKTDGVLSSLALAGSLPLAYIALGWCLCLVAVLLKWLLPTQSRSWRWHGSPRVHVAMFSQQLNSMCISVFMSMALGSPCYNWWLKLMGARIASDAVLLTSIVGDHEMLTVGKGAIVDKEAFLSSTRLLPSKERPRQHFEFCTCNNPVIIGMGSTVSHAAAVVAGETGNFSVLAPLSAVGPSARLPAQTLAVGLPPQAFVWSKEKNLIRPSARPVPRELRPPIVVPPYVSRAIGRMKVHAPASDEIAPLVTGACGFLGRHVVAELLGRCSRIFCLVRAKDAQTAQLRVEQALRNVGIDKAEFQEAVEVVPGDLSQRNFGRSFVEIQRLAGRVTHVINVAAKVNLTEPFDMMRQDNVDATAHLLEFCSSVRPKPFHHVSTMGVFTPDMLDRHGAVRETAPLGDIRCMPLYGTGDQANGYPQSKWLAEKMVFEAARQGLPSFVHRPGLIGGHSRTGAAAEDVFFHFLSDVLQLGCLPDMEGDKFNLTPVDFVAKAIVQIMLEGGTSSGSVLHPAMPDNSISIHDLANIFQLLGYQSKTMDFVDWQKKILAEPLRFKSWSFCAALTVEGHGIDSMADSTSGAHAMRAALGEDAYCSFNAKSNLKQQIRWYIAQGLLPPPGAL